MNEVDIVNLMPLFHVLNGWFGVVLFLLLGMWSKRFRLALTSQAEEKRKRLQAKYMDDEDEAGDESIASPSTAQTSPASSRPASSTSKAGSRPASSASKPPSRPATGAGSRPASGASKAASRPATAVAEAPEETPEADPEVDAEAPEIEP